MSDSLKRKVEGRRLLVHASYEGDLDLIVRLFDEGSDPNARDDGGDGALMFASVGGHFLIAKMLLTHKAVGAELPATACGAGRQKRR